jgi:hypothetical protein
MGKIERLNMEGRIEARAGSIRSHLRLIASKQRLGARIRRAVSRCFAVVDNGPILARDVLTRAFPRLRRFDSWHYKSAYRALRRVAIVIACNRSRGRPNLWSPKEPFGEVRPETTAQST